ncbi:mandelate racemase [Lederbergia sp. NSJ-179]|uniref:mandelate racemase/muconate lactonizing enzyme family protein n=1 Tax=Lederbergia sp. NSJ-179 TaxID=2931402 RepID=UPI001FD10CF8|nr:enolase C-terminal domain-like protein [Lederbergia sp. NSJ-179]MCJ7841220.1 mandelate racemase [Lederbergia sp. NSJ-179]
MKISDIEVYPLSLPMKQDYHIAGGSVGDQQKRAPHVYVKITSDTEEEGWGEARPSHRWSYETLESAVTTLNNYIKPILIEENAEDLQKIHKKMDRQIASGLAIGQPIAKAAVDMALHDLIGKHRKQSLTSLWGGMPKKNINLSYLISTSDPEKAFAKAKYAKEQGYLGVDVKIGLNPKQDAAILEAVKEAAPELFFRTDANQCYNLPQAVQLSKKMEQIGIDVFEQPLPAEDLKGHAELRRKVNIPIALDESIWGPGNLLQALRLEACDLVVIKTTKMGGLRKARLCGEIAREANIGLLGGGLTDSSLGLMASAHLFNYLDIDTPVDLNGPMFLEDDPVENGPQIDGGNVELSCGYGIGCWVDMDKLIAFSV